ncbi:PrpF domain-containing protein [Xanthobacter agilis]|uniref:2-methylaconitate cis-trans-isomerase PrpF n=1 Tax=Xanthobacter agilis TaxID=47492 RepID=A0ABU0LG44_XANAG|nr:PrpF domain-containing protein [Xanthobacter agilis]MDQ0506078.1 2-methylaconitate cis-trans-isomerase PrpF [Xanthobacter agilis]
MSYFHFDRNLEQMLAPITLIRGGSSRGFYFEGRNVPAPGAGLEEFLLAVRGSPDPMGMDGLGGDTILQSKTAIVSPSTRPGADVDYTFVQIFPDQPATVTYKMNCGNISAGVPVFALMKNMIPGVADGRLTVRAFSTNTQKMMYMTLDVLNGEARVDGDTVIGGVPGSGAEILVDFRDQGGGFTGQTFPTGNLIDTVVLSDGSKVEVTIVDMVNICGFFRAETFGLGCTGLELPSPTGAVLEPPGMLARLTELRLKIAELIGWTQYTRDTIGKATLPFAVSVAAPTGYTDLDGHAVKAESIDLVARFYLESIMHSAAPGSGSTCLAAAAAIPGTVPNMALREGALKAGQGGQLTLGHPSGTFTLNTRPVLGKSPNAITFTELSFPRTARIICDGTVYIKNSRPPEQKAWVEADDLTAASFFLRGDDITVQR